MHDLSDWDVLIVDDEPDNRGILEFVLTTYNATVRTADSAEKCLELMKEKTPTMVLADIQMPGTSGFELLTQLRSCEEWRSVPVIAITAYAMPGDRERIITAGFTGYIAKPLSVMELVDDLRKLLVPKVES